MCYSSPVSPGLRTTHWWKSVQHISVFIRNAFSDRTGFVFFTLTTILQLSTKARTFSSTEKLMSDLLTTETFSFTYKTKNFIPFLLLPHLIHSSSSLISTPSLFDSASHRVSSAKFISTHPLSYAKIINENIIYNLPPDQPPSLLEGGTSFSVAQATSS